MDFALQKPDYIAAHFWNWTLSIFPLHGPSGVDLHQVLRSKPRHVAVGLVAHRDEVGSLAGGEAGSGEPSIAPQSTQRHGVSMSVF